MRVGFPEMMDKVGHEVGSNGGQNTDTQVTVHAVRFVGYHFLYALGFIQHNLCLTDDFFADAGRGDILPVAVENLDIQFFFQLLNHRAEGRLCHAACLGCKHKVAVLVQCHDIFHLL